MSLELGVRDLSLGLLERGEAMTVERVKPESAGCWVDGHWGQYGTARVIEIASDLGWEDEEATHLAAKHLASIGPSTSEGLEDQEFEIMVDAADEAEAWLNENVAPEGYAFGWHDGEFFLWSAADWEEASY